MHAFLVWLESSGFSIWTREDPSIFAFPSILTAHTIGMGIVAGINVILAFRILGIAKDVPIAEMKRFYPVMWFGFWLNAVSGVVLLIAYPTKALTNPLFYAKLSFIAAAMVLLRVVQKKLFGTGGQVQVTPEIRRLAMVSIGCWAAAIAAGRFLAYTYHRLLSID
ncbi:MAG: DUF6644 family protein [Acidobacteriota bacterium]